MSTVDETPLEGMRRLLEHSLVAWRVIGRVVLASPATVRIECLGRVLTVVAADSRSPFRWMVTIDGRTRPAVSVLAVLSQIRAQLDLNHKPGRLRVVGSGDAG